MQLRKSKLTLALGALLALGLVGAGGYALAAPPAPGMQGPGMASGQGQWGHGAWGHGKHGHGRGMQARFAAMRDMRVLQHLYLAQGRRGDAEAMYHDVLAHTQNPGLRNFAYGQLARLQMMPTDTGAAIATLRKALNENLQQIKPPPAPAS
ncbi:MAG: hypothetical protein ACYC97_10610 [Metallibacterium sp.]